MPPFPFSSAPRRAAARRGRQPRSAGPGGCWGVLLRTSLRQTAAGPADKAGIPRPPAANTPRARRGSPLWREGPRAARTSGARRLVIAVIVLKS